MKHCSQTVSHLFNDFADHSSIHGVSYIGERGRSWVEKIWWITVFSASVICCGKLIGDAWLISPIIISFTAKPTPIFQIPFPAVTICPGTFVSNDVVHLKEIDERIAMDPHYFDGLTKEKKLHTLVKNAFCNGGLYLSNLTIFENCNECLKILHKIKISIDDIFVKCRFGNQEISCSESFEEVVIKTYICYTFNGLPIYRQGSSKHQDLNWSIDEGYTRSAPLDTYPRRALRAGPQVGLSVLLKTKRQDLDYYCSTTSGTLLGQRMPYDSPQGATDMFEVGLDATMAVMVKPKSMTMAAELRGYSLEDRKCYYSNEYQLKYYEQYTLSNCELECEIDFYRELCGCVPIKIKPHNGLNNCAPVHFRCMNDARKLFLGKSLSECNCLPACTSITFESEVSVARGNLSSSFIDSKEFGYTQITVFFKENEFLESQRSERYGFVAFLANSGGLLGLFLGVSIVSLIEILFFCTIRLWCSRGRVASDNLNNSEVPETCTKKELCLGVVKNLITEYFARTTIQGLTYVAETRLSRTERIWWVIVFTASVFCCGSLISNTINQYDQSPVIISYANEETSISEIPYPAITICPQFISRQVVRMFDYFKVKNLSLYDLNNFWSNIVTALAQTCDPAVFGDVDPKNLTTCENCTKFLNNMIGNIVSKVMTEEGVCLQFNGVEVFRGVDAINYDDEEWTLEGGYKNRSSQVDARPRRGSKFRLDLSLLAENVFNDALCRDAVQGFKIYLHLPNESPQVAKHFYLAAYHYFAQVIVDPRVTVTAPELRDLSVQKRQCYFSDERYLRFFRHYTQSNCENECVVNMTLLGCGCLLFHMPKITGVKYCGISDIKCQKAVIKEKFNQSQTSACQCLATCTSITYDAQINVHYIPDAEMAYSHSPYAATHRIASFGIGFRNNQFVAMRRSKLFGPTELLANIGGLLGLFLGFSFLSLMEVVYYCTLRVICDFKLRIRRK